MRLLWNEAGAAAGEQSVHYGKGRSARPLPTGTSACIDCSLNLTTNTPTEDMGSSGETEIMENTGNYGICPDTSPTLYSGSNFSVVHKDIKPRSPDQSEIKLFKPIEMCSKGNYKII